MSPIPKMRAGLGLGEGYHSPQVEVDVRLNTNESPEPPPEAWREVFAKEAAAVDFNRYPDRSAKRLRAGLAELHAVEPDNVWLGNGSNEVLQSLCLAYGGAGRAALTFEPTYALHSHIAHLTGTAVVRASRRNDFTLDADLVLDVLRTEAPAITFLCSPNNPTGNSEDRSLVASVVEAAPGLVVVDEAYGQFADWSARDLLDDASPLVVTRTFSKTWSMAAVRLGYALAPEPVVALLERVVLPYHLGALTQAAGLLALAHVGEMEARVGLLVRERQRLVAGLGQLPVTVWPSQANFVLFRPEGRTGRDVWQGLVDRSVLVRDTSSWPGLDGCLRVTVGTETENDRFLWALRQVLGAG